MHGIFIGQIPGFPGEWEPRHADTAIATGFYIPGTYIQIAVRITSVPEG